MKKSNHAPPQTVRHCDCDRDPRHLRHAPRHGACQSLVFVSVLIHVAPFADAENVYMVKQMKD